MHHIPVEPPAFFHRGPSPLSRLALLGLLSIALLFADSRFRYLENVRQVVGIVLYPLQRAVQLPGEAVAYVGDYFGSKRQLADDNAHLKQELVAQAPAVHSAAIAEIENARLKALLDVSRRFPGAAIAVEVLYMGRDPFSQKVFVSKGVDAGVKAGDAVIDDQGVVGQVTRAYPMMGEVTLIIGPEGGWTDDEIALAQAHGCWLERLGARRLRAETAALAACAIAGRRYGAL